MLLAKNPDKKTIKTIIAKSPHKAAKWLKDIETGDTYYWEGTSERHAVIADMLGIKEYEKGLAI